jgi:phage repressor protein C with HTH and peptisase S24 domain
MAGLGAVSKGSQILYEKGNAPTADYLTGIAKGGADILYILTGIRSPFLPFGMALHGETPEERQAIARLNATMAGPDFSTLAAGPPRRSDPPSPIDTSDFVAIPVHRATLAAGNGDVNEAEELVGHVAFHRSWLRNLRVAPTAAVIAHARGDSMSPTIEEGDAVLIDRLSAAAPDRPRDPADQRPAPIYALLDDGNARIKRIVCAAQGTLALLSDNPATAPEIRPTSAVSIIGRVRWWGHTNRD